MGTAWDLRCIDCDSAAGFMLHGEYGESILADLWAAREQLAALAKVKVGGQWIDLDYNQDSLRAWWFAEHKDHNVRRRDEYGRFAGDCHRYVPCTTCHKQGPCALAEKHEGACSVVKPSPSKGQVPAVVPGPPGATADPRVRWDEAIQRIKDASRELRAHDRSPTDLITDLAGAIGAELDRAAHEGQAPVYPPRALDLAEMPLPPSGVIRLAQPLHRQAELVQAVLACAPIALPPLPGRWIVHRMARVDMERIAVEASTYAEPPPVEPLHTSQPMSSFGAIAKAALSRTPTTLDGHEGQWMIRDVLLKDGKMYVEAVPFVAPVSATTSPCPPNEDGVPCDRGARDPNHTGICMGTEMGGGSVSWWRPDLAARAASEEPTPR